MFDDKKEPVDIFADVDKTPPGGARPAAQTEVVTPPVSPQNARGPSKLLLGIILLVIIGLGAGGYFLFAGKKAAPAPENQVATQPPANVAPPANTAAPAPAPTTNTAAPAPAVNAQPAVNAAPTNAPDVNQPAPPAPTQPVNPPDQIQQPVDSDGDGLTDDQEAKLGTNPHDPDTDHDGLSDGDEVNKWHTNPLKADTDGDGYLDGDEVAKGYNPLGQGKLPAPPKP
jgi:type IV secretory pathway VirB10-like protein